MMDLSEDCKMMRKKNKVSYNNLITNSKKNGKTTLKITY